jgi:hypothetical protein
MTDGFLSLGELEDILDSALSGFVHPPRKQVVPLLGDGSSSSGNSVLQESAKGYREASLSFTVFTGADMLIVRGYAETSETVDLVDYDGNTRYVRLLDFTATLAHGDVWRVGVVLQELAEPVPPGS